MVFIFNITSNSLKFSDIKIYFWWLNKKSLTMSWCSAGFEAILRHIYIPFIFISLLYPNNISNFSSRKLGSFLVLFSSLSPPDKFLDKYTLVHLFTHLYFLYLWLYLLEFFVFCFFFVLFEYSLQEYLQSGSLCGKLVMTMHISTGQDTPGQISTIWPGLSCGWWALTSKHQNHLRGRRLPWSLHMAKIHFTVDLL